MLDFLSVCLCPPEVEVCGDEVSVLPAGVGGGGGGECESTVHPLSPPTVFDFSLLSSGS